MINAEEGILHALKSENPQLTKDYCIYYNPNWTSLPSALSNTTSTRLEFLTPKLLCSRSDATRETVKDKAIVVMRGNCTFLEKAELAQSLGAKILLIASESGLNTPHGNKTQNITIPIALVRNEDIIDLKQNLGKNVNMTLYAPPVPNFDYSMVVIFLIAVLCVAAGGYWSGIAELENLKVVPSGGSSDSKNEENVTLTPVAIVVFVAICCIMLVLMYYFYKWLVYVVIAVFCLASATSLFHCLSALVRKIPYGQCRFPCWNKCIEVRLLFLGVMCIATSVVWAVFRNENRWAWILQDLLGIAFCVNFIKTLKLPNFKSCVILLGLLLVYDVFFVFITPYLTKSGESIMVEVAAGPFENSEKNDGNLVEASAERSAPHEKLPVVIKVPRLVFSATMLCAMPFSLLGFGDIVVPGLLVAYCHRFDVQTSSSSVYFISCTIAYAAGMLITFMGLALMKMAQPALLYLVPCTLIVCTLLALYRKEMKKFWSGNNYQVMDPMDFTANEENSTRANEQHEGQ
ncbi:signal peptide peptidase-like 2A isoform X2 [Rhineura floridana]|uniref:signal peptide peptidase-like 2A isoform X2 n=1 Tax=Rhineura floridana TaxID=261503 RepID=UPI002AC7F5FB|nr:signal peptide peptidase-like 2A isoform X2 [Rhineura floridana]XP_061450962.1 signal peptide peptidase-like 2A isoform X2 [Rhineura floridana]